MFQYIHQGGNPGEYRNKNLIIPQSQKGTIKMITNPKLNSHYAWLYVNLKYIHFLLQKLSHSTHAPTSKQVHLIIRLLCLLIVGTTVFQQHSDLPIFKHWNQELVSLAYETNLDSKNGFRYLVTYQIESIQLVLNCLYQSQNESIK